MGHIGSTLRDMSTALALTTTKATTTCGCAESSHSSGSGTTATSFQSDAVAQSSDAPAMQVPWEGVLVIEGEMTGDGRLIEPNALRWESGSIPLRYVSSDVGAHDGATVVGRIDRIWRAGDEIRGEGIIDTATPDGAEALRQVREELQNGISVDLDDVSFEIRVAKELLEADLGLGFLFEDPEDDEDAPAEEVDEEGRVTVVRMASDEEVSVTTSGRIRAGTLVSIPAFHRAKITALAEESGDPTDAAVPVKASLVAAAAPYPVEPPLAWFENPQLAEPTPLQVLESGRVFGHIATWGTCHVGHAHQGCITPPRSASDYSHFHLGSILTAEGSEIAVGRLTLDTVHAKEHDTAAATLAHYEKTGLAVADVRAGEDAHGIWIAGALRPRTTPEQVRALRSSPISGDWRRIGSALELVAALAVNVPGFPIPRVKGLVAGGAVQSLVASGMLAPSKVLPPGVVGAFSEDDLRYLKRLIQRERTDDAMENLAVRDSAAALAQRVRTTALAARRRSWKIPKEER